MGTLRVIFCIFLLSTIIYLNALGNGFVADDTDIIVNYEQIRSLRNIPQFFTSQDVLTPDDSTGYYRPLARFSYAIDYLFWGLNPFGFHLNNILLHGITSVAFFLAMSLLYPGAPALVAAVLFAAHPVHVEAVTWITGRNNILAGLFLLLSFYCYVRSDPATSDPRRRVYSWLALFCYCLALLSKEFALVFPLFLVLYHACFDGGDGRDNGKKRLRHVAGRLVPYLFCLAAYLFVRSIVVGSSVRISLETLPRNVLHSLKAFAAYLYTLALPVKLVTTSFIPSQEPLLNWKGIAALVVAALLAVTAVASWRRGKKVFFALGFLVVFFIPVSNIVSFNPVPVAERYAYLSSMGFCLLLGLLAEVVIKRFRLAVVVSVILLVSLYSVRTWTRNRDWKDNITLFQSTVASIPDSPIAHYTLGKAYLEKGREEEAISSLRRSAALNPNFPHSRLTLAMIYQDKGEWDRAIAIYRDVLRLMPDNDRARSGLAFVYYQRDMREDAVRELREVLRINPHDEDARKNLAAILAEMATMGAAGEKK